jgi:Rab GDP dissociation inhibitor
MAEEEDQQPQVPRNFDWLPAGCEPLADGEYDAIVMGTGLTECIMSGLLSVQGMRVLHIDRNHYYGGESASLSLTNLFEKFGRGQPPAALGTNRDWNVDLIPKFIMACGNLVKILLHTKVTRYLEFKSVDGSYVFKDRRVLKVPATPDEALMSPLMGFFEKRKFRSFLMYVSAYERDDPKTHQRRDLHAMTMRQLYNEFGLDADTQQFTGHAMALWRDETYLDRPAIETVEAVQLYAYSLERYGKSPYIYPIYGLGGLPEGFSRLCAINGGTFMLNQPIDEILFNDAGVAWGVRAGTQVAKASLLLGDPSYFPPAKSRVSNQVVRSICIMDHPIPSTDNAESCQIIIPAAQLGRHHDIYVCMVSFAHMVAARGYYIAIASTTVETRNPISELEPAIAMLGGVLERFDTVADLYEPLSEGFADRCFISKSYDATSHFESAAQDVLSLYQRVTGQQLDMSISADTTEADP